MAFTASGLRRRLGSAALLLALLGCGRSPPTTAADLVGVWVHKSGEAVVWETTFRADGTCEEYFPGDNTRYTGTYVVSPDGKRLQMTLNGQRGSDWHVEFNGKDAFTIHEDSRERLTFTYVRKK
jgi:hypothetical protein